MLATLLSKRVLWKVAFYSSLFVTYLWVSDR